MAPMVRVGTGDRCRPGSTALKHVLLCPLYPTWLQMTNEQAQDYCKRKGTFVTNQQRGVQKVSGHSVMDTCFERTRAQVVLGLSRCGRLLLQLLCEECDPLAHGARWNLPRTQQSSDGAATVVTAGCCVQAAQERRNQLVQVTEVLQSKMAAMQAGAAGSSAAAAGSK